MIKPIRNTKKQLRKVRTHKRLIDYGIRAALYTSGADLVDDVRKRINEPPKTGIKYSGLPNRSSSPGESPATQSGRLMKSSSYTVRGSSQMTFGEKANYAKFLEMGTSRMQSRPHMSESIKSLSRNIIRDLGQTAYNMILRVS